MFTPQSILFFIVWTLLLRTHGVPLGSWINKWKREGRTKVRINLNHSKESQLTKNFWYVLVDEMWIFLVEPFAFRFGPYHETIHGPFDALFRRTGRLILIIIIMSDPRPPTIRRVTPSLQALLLWFVAGCSWVFKQPSESIIPLPTGVLMMTSLNRTIQFRLIIISLPLLGQREIERLFLFFHHHLPPRLTNPVISGATSRTITVTYMIHDRSRGSTLAMKRRRGHVPRIPIWPNERAPHDRCCWSIHLGGGRGRYLSGRCPCLFLLVIHFMFHGDRLSAGSTLVCTHHRTDFKCETIDMDIAGIKQFEGAISTTMSLGWLMAENLWIFIVKNMNEAIHILCILMCLQSSGKRNNECRWSWSFAWIIVIPQWKYWNLIYTHLTHEFSPNTIKPHKFFCSTFIDMFIDHHLSPKNPHWNSLIVGNWISWGHQVALALLFNCWPLLQMTLLSLTCRLTPTIPQPLYHQWSSSCSTVHGPLQWSLKREGSRRTSAW